MLNYKKKVSDLATRLSNSPSPLTPELNQLAVYLTAARNGVDDFDTRLKVYLLR